MPAKKRRGPKPHEPTPCQRKQVAACMVAGLTEDMTASILGINKSTLRKHYKPELEQSRAKVVTKIASTLAQKAMNGDNACMFFYLKTRAGWRETQRHEHSGEVKGGKGPNLTVEIVASDKVEE